MASECGQPLTLALTTTVRLGYILFPIVMHNALGFISANRQDHQRATPIIFVKNWTKVNKLPWIRNMVSWSSNLQRHTYL